MIFYLSPSLEMWGYQQGFAIIQRVPLILLVLRFSLASVSFSGSLWSLQHRTNCWPTATYELLRLFGSITNRYAKILRSVLCFGTETLHPLEYADTPNLPSHTIPFSNAQWWKTSQIKWNIQVVLSIQNITNRIIIASDVTSPSVFCLIITVYSTH